MEIAIPSKYCQNPPVSKAARAARVARRTTSRSDPIVAAPPFSRERSALLVGPGAPAAAGDAELELIRRAIRAEYKLGITYRDAEARPTTRTTWPFTLAFFDRVRVVVAWCELRDGYRHFRTDRIAAIKHSRARYLRRRLGLLMEWQESEGIQPP